MSGISSSQRASTPLLNAANTGIQSSDSTRDVEENRRLNFRSNFSSHYNRPSLPTPIIVGSIVLTAVASAYSFYVLATISKTPSASEVENYRKTARALLITSGVAITVQSNALAVFLSGEGRFYAALTRQILFNSYPTLNAAFLAEPLFSKEGEKYSLELALGIYIPIIVMTFFAKCCCNRIRPEELQGHRLLATVRSVEFLSYLISIGTTSALFALLHDNREYGQDTAMAQSILAPIAMAFFSMELLSKTFLIAGDAY
jgi:hypothetical protein